MSDAAGEKAGLSVIGRAFLARLCDIADGCDRRIHAVMDGARFGGLPSRLSEAGLHHRPLYRGTGADTAVVLGGPWLVSLSMAPPSPSPPSLATLDDAGEPSEEELAALAARLSAEMAEAVANGDESGGGMLPTDEIDRPDRVKGRIEALLELVEDKPGIVFWIGDRSVSEEEIYRHLRGINRILLPLERDAAAGSALSEASEGGEIALAAGAPEEDGPPADIGDGGRERYEAVVFRHADPNVIMQVFPTLLPEQVARLMGPAEQILFAPAEEWGGSIKRGRRLQGIPTPSGYLRLLDDNLDQIRARRFGVMRDRRVAYLKKCCADELAEATPQALSDHVWLSEQSGRQLGLVSEAAHCRWAYLMFATRGQIATSPEVAQYIRHGGANPDRQVGRVMKSTIAALQAQRAQIGAGK